MFAAMDVVKKDFQNSSNGQCQVALAKGKVPNPALVWGMAKHSYYMESFNRGCAIYSEY